MKILVTGAAGFIGSNFVRMVATGHLQGISGITVLDKLTYAGVRENLESAEKSPNYQFIQGDICDRVRVNQLISGVEAVVNFAAESHVDRSISSASDFVQTNIVEFKFFLIQSKHLVGRSAFSKFQPMKFMDLSTKALGKKSGRCCQTHPIQQVKRAVSYWLVLITGPTAWML